jgi:hypothetical protein
LQDNGGPTQTLAIPPDSAATNAALDSNCPATDQRGIARPQGAHCDSGAFEVEDQYLQDQADLGLTQRGRLRDGTAVLMLNATNHGPQEADGVILTAKLSQGMTFKRATSSAGACHYVARKHKVRCKVGAMGAQAQVEVKLTAGWEAQAGRLVSRGAVHSATPDYDLKNNSAKVQLDVP